MLQEFGCMVAMLQILRHIEVHGPGAAHFQVTHHFGAGTSLGESNGESTELSFWTLEGLLLSFPSVLLEGKSISHTPHTCQALVCAHLWWFKIKMFVMWPNSRRAHRSETLRVHASI